MEKEISSEMLRYETQRWPLIKSAHHCDTTV